MPQLHSQRMQAVGFHAESVALDGAGVAASVTSLRFAHVLLLRLPDLRSFSRRRIFVTIVMFDLFITTVIK